MNPDPFDDDFEECERPCLRCGEHFTAYRSYERLCMACGRAQILEDDEPPFGPMDPP